MNCSASTGTDPEHEDAVQVSRYELVFYDTVVATYPASNLRGFLHASAPQMGRAGTEANPENFAAWRQCNLGVIRERLNAGRQRVANAKSVRDAASKPPVTKTIFPGWTAPHGKHAR